MFKIFSVSVIVFFLFFSCKKDNTPSGAIENLTFSEDTIFFDTLFAELPNVTKVFKVYNSSNDDILIDKIFFLFLFWIFNHLLRIENFFWYLVKFVLIIWIVFSVR